MPALVRRSEFVELRGRYESFRLGGGSRMLQTKLGPESSLDAIDRLALPYVEELFARKCAYTEIPLAEGRFHLHRPAADAFDPDLGPSPRHYWWTAAWWRNWYLASDEVVSLKRNHFPVIGRRALPPTGRGATLRADRLDRGVLLDPCEDHPAWHLRFSEDGLVSAWGTDRQVTWLEGDERTRGPATISMLALNSRRLVTHRRTTIQAVLRDLMEAKLPYDRILDRRTPFLGAIRQVVAARYAAGDDVPVPPSAILPELAPLLAFNPSGHPKAVIDLVNRHIASLPPPLAKPITFRRRATQAAAPREATVVASDVPNVITRSDAIARVLIENFQSIEKVDLPLETNQVKLARLTQDSDPIMGRPWKTLLGENGTGKSATLRAIGLALAGDDVDRLVASAQLTWKRLLRRKAKRGRILLVFTSGASIDLRFNATRSWFRGDVPKMDGFVRGFGVTRGLGDRDASPTANVRLDNLFDPRLPVIDAESWLLGLPSVGDFNVAAVSIAQLLDRTEAVTTAESVAPFMSREGGTLTVDGEPIENLSEGYRAVIGMACDLMAGAGQGLEDMSNATGIVLVDEIGAHMHPKWKMKITGNLRHIFPSMQFVVSTHEPLCLLGLEANEVIRVHQSARDENHEWRTVFNPIALSPSRFRVDRLLTSDFFGLNTTIDPRVERDFRDYYALVRTHDPTAEERTRRDTLRAQLSQHGVLGYTRRDQMVYEAIDQFLATEEVLAPSERLARRQQTLRQVGDIWRAVAERRQVTSP